MKFTFLKFKKNNPLSLESLRPPLFNINLFWTLALGFFVGIVIITASIGFKLYYYQYSENYKKSFIENNSEEIIDVGRLKSAILKRNDFINQPVSSTTDPSI